ncbi:hypothetical protein Ctob_012765 [Chrysochromulina tobinii]|uniref:Uncharacterized protein n=1 Tax=Chrysochromulina tobinii TaxID=1460289 RepID=A0A0M0K1U0_9EUKA|nr:hypothetical protein Ctob_012765 [Chrysochromulina tobinii]|eukprot:KOO32779.1 hypothetical protein Ctob_012765 [Chrysochromulina sp. CCMP291]
MAACSMSLDLVIELKMSSRDSRERSSLADELSKLLSASIGRSFLKRQFIPSWATPFHDTGTPSMRSIRQSVSRIMLRCPMRARPTSAVAFGQ